MLFRGIQALCILGRQEHTVGAHYAYPETPTRGEPPLCSMCKCEPPFDALPTVRRLLHHESDILEQHWELARSPSRLFYTVSNSFPDIAGALPPRGSIP